MPYDACMLRRGVNRRTTMCVAIALLLLTACEPSDPARQEGLDRSSAAAARLAETPGADAHGARLSAAMETLAAVEALQPSFQELVTLLDQLRVMPPGTAATNLRAEIDAISAAMLATPEAAAGFDQLRHALQTIRDDVPAAESFDATLRGISDAAVAPTNWFPPKVGVYGDSAAFNLRTNSSAYTGTSNPTKKLRLGGGYVTIGCGTLITNSTCGTAEQWGNRSADNATHIALIYAGIWETKCWTFEDWAECHHLGEPIYDDYIRRNLDARTEALLEAGVPIVVYVKTNDRRLDDGTNPEHSARWERWYELLDEHVARYDRVITLDLVPWWHANPELDVLYRPDGYHFTTNAWMFWRDVLEQDLYWDLWFPRFGRQYHNYPAWTPVIGQLWAETTPPPLVTGPGLSTTTTTTSPPTTAP